MLSDGKSSVGGVTGQDVTAKIISGEIKDGSIIEMTDYACNFINQEHKIVLTGAVRLSLLHPVPAHFVVLQGAIFSRDMGAKASLARGMGRMGTVMNPVHSKGRGIVSNRMLLTRRRSLPSLLHTTLLLSQAPVAQWMATEA